MAIETPLQKAIHLSAKTENTILLKREDLQPVFSFKCRGGTLDPSYTHEQLHLAHNKMAHLTDQEKLCGVVACSAGNHAQGVALAASKMNVKATIVMPSGYS